tara:strand:+ start:336 stop:935 length:600 start_codon:yes stop_codon:yes gene_type:complete
MTYFIKKSDDKILTEVWDSLIEFYDNIDKQEIASKVPIGYHVNIYDPTKTYPDFIKNLKEYFNSDIYWQGLSFFEINDPGWGKHVDGTASEPRKVFTGSCIWPIKNCSSENITKWYEHTKGESIYKETDRFGQKNSGYFDFSDDSEFTLTDSTSIDGPTIIRTDVAHEVNSPNKTRVVASWKIGSTEEITWDKICDLYQ